MVANSIIKTYISVAGGSLMASILLARDVYLSGLGLTRFGSFVYVPSQAMVISGQGRPHLDVTLTLPSQFSICNVYVTLFCLLRENSRVAFAQYRRLDR